MGHNAIHAVDVETTVRQGPPGAARTVSTIPRALFMTGDVRTIRLRLERRYGTCVAEGLDGPYLAFRFARKPWYVPEDMVVLTRCVLRCHAVRHPTYVHQRLQ